MEGPSTLRAHLSVPAIRIFRNRASERQPALAAFCGQCGYELAPDSDGTCPMCPRFQQIRMHLPEPRKSAVQRVRSSINLPPHPGVIRNRAVRGNRPPSEISPRDATSAEGDAAGTSRQHPTGQLTKGAPVIRPTTPAGERSVPTQHEARVPSGHEVGGPSRSWAVWMRLGPAAAIALIDLFLIGALIGSAMPVSLPFLR
jgi:hypothetical protein